MKRALKSFSTLCFVISLIILLVGCLGTEPAGPATSNESSSEDSSQAEDSSEESSSMVEEVSSDGVSSVDDGVSSSEVESSEGQSSSEEQSSGESSSEMVSSSSSSGSSSSALESSSVAASSSSENVQSSSSFVAVVKGEFTLVIEDDFNDLNLDFWEKSDGSWKDNMCQFVESGVAVEGGNLQLIMTGDDTQSERLWGQRTLTNPDGEYQDPFWENPVTKNWASGELRSLKTYKYGRFETTIKSPVQKYYLSTFFLFNLPRDDQWLEIDIEIMSLHQNQPTTNLLIDKAGGAWEWGQIDHNKLDVHHPEVVMDHKVFNDFAIEWTPDYIAWFVNDVKIREITDKELIPDKPLHAVFNFWLSSAGLSNDGTVPKAETPPHVIPENYLDGETAVTEYEYFRYYKWSGEDDYEHGAWCGNKSWDETRCQ